MEARELRIGNYIYDNEVGWKGEFRVCAGDIKTIDDNQKEFDYSALPLTEEWLVKFGFEFKDLDTKKYPTLTYGFYYSHENTGFNLHLYEDSEEIMEALNIEGWSDGFYFVYDNWSVWRRINYVHQLQNLYFALYGEELELKNND